jgi:N-acetylmuramoyl-L-alanine amidase
LTPNGVGRYVLFFLLKIMPNLFDSLSDTQLLALLLHGEARGESPAGMLAVAHVVLNRYGKRTWYGSTIRGVILKPWQFSYFNGLSAIPQVDKSCSLIAELVMGGCTVDVSLGATHYWSRIMLPEPPKWAANMVETVRLGGHVFCKERGE